MKKLNLELTEKQLVVLQEVINNIDIQHLKDMVRRGYLPSTIDIFDWDDVLYEVWKKLEELKWT